jgi:hypothetical protein
MISKKIGTDHGLGEDLQQQPFAVGRRTVDQDPVAAQIIGWLRLY